VYKASRAVSGLPADRRVVDVHCCRGRGTGRSTGKPARAELTTAPVSANWGTGATSNPRNLRSVLLGPRSCHRGLAILDGNVNVGERERSVCEHDAG